MRYSSDIAKEIIAELEKVPIVRQVCSKVGIDHSTFYRWLVKHPTFNGKVMMALSLGRKKVNDVAESIILTGIQNKEFKSATFWLKHNEPRYMSLHQGRQHDTLIGNQLRVMDRELAEETSVIFEKFFEMFYKHEQNYEPELVELIMKPIVELLCAEDARLIDVFYSAYDSWKKERIFVDKKVRDIGLEDIDITPPKNP